MAASQETNPRFTAFSGRGRHDLFRAATFVAHNEAAGRATPALRQGRTFICRGHVN
jgi:hypothetical protein